MTEDNPRPSNENFVPTIFTRFFSVFSNLLYLNCQLYSKSNQLVVSFSNQTPTFFSSTLLNLRVKLQTFDDCLYLLDGRLSQLRSFDVNVDYVVDPSPAIQQTVSDFRRSKEGEEWMELN